MKIVFVLLFVFALYAVGIFLFAFGFLLNRIVVAQNSTCHDHGPSAGRPEKVNDADDVCWLKGRYRRAVVIVVDAFRFDFVFYNRSIEPGKDRAFENKLLSVRDALDRTPQNARLYRFVADPPTTTLQRLKGLTTGSLPTFVDAGANFASTEITEDNFIDQLVKLRGNVTFMGDDTWQGLFPGRFRRSYPFPSFNVKDLDTVDNGIVERLLPEYRRDDWNLLVAHFLGVDHCGHTFGPYHGKMTEKLTQMDTVIKSVMDIMTDDTVLFVLGDHGMTRTGDHGGDSGDEVDAALFVYSPLPITSSPVTQVGYKTISQIDFVPTFSLLLGLPIPFSNLGSIIADLFDHENATNVGSYDQIDAIRLNALQVHRYTVEYRKLSSDLPRRTLSRLDDVFREAEERHHVLLESVAGERLKATAAAGRLEALRSIYADYLSGVKAMCRDVWAQFDTSSMSLGTFVYCAALFLHFLLVSHPSPTFESSSSLVSRSLSGSSFCAVVAALVYFRVVGEYVFCAAVVFSALIVIRYTKLKEVEEILCGWRLNRVDVLSLLLCCVHFAGLFSNSFVVYEDAVAAFIFQTLIGLFVASVVFDLATTTRSSNSERKHGRNAKSNVGHKQFRSHVFVVFFVSFLILVGVRLSRFFRACREEQTTCEPSFFVRPLSALATDVAFYVDVRLLLAVLGASAATFGTYRWMRHHGNLNGGAVAVAIASYVVPFSCVVVIFYWLTQSLPSNVPSAVVPSWIQLTAARYVYYLFAATVVVVTVRPLCLFLVPKRRTSDNDAEILLPTVPTENLIPQIYNQLRLNYKRNLNESSQEPSADDDSQPPCVVYGLATAYSASHLVLVLAVAMVIMLLLGDGIAPSVFLLWTVVFGLLEIHSTYVRLKGEITTPWISVISVFFLSSEHFFSTGHQATIPSIRWESAYHGFSGDFPTNAIPAVLIATNTFSSYILCTVALPLLIYWPFTRGRHHATDRNRTETEERKGEFLLNEEKTLLRKMLFKLYTRFILLFALRLLFMMICVNIHRRHLMVWKIFAPRFVFEVATFLTVSSMSLLTSLFVLRTDNCLRKWIEKLET